jgi:hypothetical protein
MELPFNPPDIQNLPPRLTHTPRKTDIGISFGLELGWGRMAKQLLSTGTSSDFLDSQGSFSAFLHHKRLNATAGFS